MAHTIYNDYWNKDNGNETRILDYPLNENSWVVELGGFQGWFTERVVEKFDCNILTIEPIFCDTLSSKFEDNSKVRIDCCGISDETKEVFLFVNGDATSKYTEVSNHTQKIICHPIEYFLKKYEIEKIDLVQINIEGEEYPLLEKWIELDILDNIKYIQVQYHDFVDNFRNRKVLIEEGLKSRGFINQWDYDLVWTSWKNTKYNS